MQVISNPGLQACCECGKRKLCLADYLIGKHIDTDLPDLIQNTCYVPYKTVFCQGNCIKNLFFVKSGSLKNVYTGEDGEQQIIGFHFPGELIGPTSLKHTCHLTSAITLENSIVCAFPKKFILAGCEKLPNLHAHILSRSEAELKHHHETLLGITQRSSLNRVAMFLLDLILRQNLIRNNAASLYLTMTRSEIANYLGLTPETVSRTLSKFKQLGLILTQKKHIRVNDIKKLSNLVN